MYGTVWIKGDSKTSFSFVKIYYIYIYIDQSRIIVKTNMLQDS